MHAAFRTETFIAGLDNEFYFIQMAFLTGKIPDLNTGIFRCPFNCE
jgi:hypothetical protein